MGREKSYKAFNEHFAFAIYVVVFYYAVPHHLQCHVGAKRCADTNICCFASDLLSLVSQSLYHYV